MLLQAGYIDKMDRSKFSENNIRGLKRRFRAYDLLLRGSIKSFELVPERQKRMLVDYLTLGAPLNLNFRQQIELLFMPEISLKEFEELILYAVQFKNELEIIVCGIDFKDEFFSILESAVKERLKLLFF
jgi:hypothetical protein